MIMLNSLPEDQLESSKQQPTFVIVPSRASLNLREIWEYRDLLLILAGRDVRLRYKQTILGVSWVILQPLVTSILFAIIFGNFARLPSDDQPYILFVFAGLLPWNLFAASLQRAGTSLIDSSALVSKVYFPRVLIPLGSVAAVLIDFLVSLSVMILLMVVYDTPLSSRMLAAPIFILIALMSAMGASLWVSSWSVYYRDFIFALPFVIQAWTYASPVVYAMSVVPEKWRWVFSLNPAVGFVEGFRWSLLGSNSLSLEMVLISAISALVLFGSGLYVFRRIEQGFADVI
jgi:lipopolysaccharide transport system permease protein